MIAGRICVPGSLTRSRSFAIAAFIAWGGDARRFPQLILSLSNQGKAAEMMAARPAARSSARPSARPAVRVLVSSHLVPCLVPPCCSKQEAAFSSTRLPACLVLPPRQILRPLPIPSRFSSRLASRSSSRSPAVSLCLSVLIPFRLARCVARLPPRRFVQLILSSSSHVLPPSSPHDRIPQAEHGYRLTPHPRTKQARHEQPA